MEARRLFGLLTGLLLAASTTIMAATAQGDGPPKLGISPIGVEGSFFALELSPGEQRQLKVEVANFGTEDVEARTYSADVVTLPNGGFGARLAGEPASGPTRWLDYRDDTFSLAAGEKQSRDFTVRVPEKAQPGEYITSLVIQTAEPVVIGDATPEATFGFNQILRQAIAVAITIPGPRTPQLEIGDITYLGTPAPVLQVSVANTGNVHLSPDAEVVLRDSEGSEVTSAKLTMSTFYTGTTTSIDVRLVKPLAPGSYLTSVTLREDGIEGIDPIVVQRDEIPLVVEAPEVSGTAVSRTIAIEAVVVKELRAATDRLQAVEVLASINNPGAPVVGARLTLVVERDGVEVERYVLISSLTFPAGGAKFTQRYVPLEGWVPGTYRFSLVLEAADPNTGSMIELATLESESTITVP